MTTATNILRYLEGNPALQIKHEKQGQYRLNSPLRPGSNSHAFTLKVDPDGEHGAYTDHVTGEAGSLYELAAQLGIEHPTGQAAPAAATKTGYTGLADYARRHNAPAAAFTAAGWVEIIKAGRAALRFPTANGSRWRYLDGEKPFFTSERGYSPCWYGLQRAAKMATDTGQPLVLCNGEPSVITAQHWGLAATCITSGEKGNIPDNLLSELQTAYPAGLIIMAYDSDNTGRKAATGQAVQLAGAGYTVKAVDLGGHTGFDLADFCGLHQQETVAALLTCRELSPEPVASEGKPTHDELARQWLSTAPITCHGMGDWRRYSEGIWAVTPEAAIKREFMEVLIAAKSTGIKPTNSTLASVTEFGRLMVWQDDSRFDSNPDWLVCGNGNLHIPTRELHPHTPELYATSKVSYAYDPAATCPHWDRFLLSIPWTVTQYLQEFAGYALTTDTSLETAIWLYGPPGGGKSTFIGGLQAMLGNRAGLLGLADIEKSRFALTELPGKTLAIATEQPGGFVTATSTLNAIISGEPITVDRKFKDAIIVTPRAKLLWAMNELPRVSDPNSGLFRRVHIVELAAIAPEKRDPTLKDKIAKEGAGILNWALAGLARLRERGRFAPPLEVTEATATFKNTNDIPGVFVADCCLTGEDYRVGATDLYNAYRVWCLDNGHKPQSSTSIATDWKRLGFEKYLSGGRSNWRFVGLKVAG